MSRQAAQGVSVDPSAPGAGQPGDAQWQQILEALPAQWRPVAGKYGPALMQMSVDGLWDWVELLSAGRDDEAYRRLLEKMPPGDLLAEWNTVETAWAKANRGAAGRGALVRQAAGAVLQVLLAAALIRLGLPAPL